MAKSLSPDEYRVLAQFLKRWGIDHPELLAEMTDHYGEKALDEMSEGKSFDRVLAGWKTKNTYLTLRKIQREYDLLYPKRWQKTQWTVAKSIILSKHLIWLILLVLVLCWIYTFPNTRKIFEYTIAIKIVVVFGVIIYFLVKKRYRNIVSFRNFSVYYVLYVTLAQFAFKELWPADPEKANNNILVPILLGVSVFIDFIYVRLWKLTLEETAHLSAEMLEDYVPKVYDPEKSQG